MDNNENKNSFVSKHKTKIFIVILLIALSLRLYNLSNKFTHIDETMALKYSMLTTSELMNTLSTKVPHPPLPYLLMHQWIKLVYPTLLKSNVDVFNTDYQSFINPRFVLRLPGIFFSMITLILLYKFALMIYNYKIALSSCVIFALSRFEIFWSQTIRYPTLVMLLSLTSTFLFYLLYTRLKDGKSDNLVFISIGYILATILGLYTQYYMFLIILFQNIFLFIKIKEIKRIWIWFLVECIVVIGFLFWLPVLIKQLKITAPESYGVVKATMFSIPLLLYRFLFMYGLQTYTPVGGLVGIVCFLIFAVLLISSIKGNKLIIYLNLFVPITIVFLLTPIKQLFVEHYFMFCFPAYSIFMGVGLSKITRLCRFTKTKPLQA